MSPVIEMGLDFAAAAQEAQKANQPARPSVYELQCRKADYIAPEGEKGPKIRFELVIINTPDPEANGKTINYFANLPNNGSFKGVQYLTDIINAFGGRGYVGNQLNTDQCIGATCRANVGVSKDGKWNEITSFV